MRPSSQCVVDVAPHIAAHVSCADRLVLRVEEGEAYSDVHARGPMGRPRTSYVLTERANIVKPRHGDFGAAVAGFFWFYPCAYGCRLGAPKSSMSKRDFQYCISRGAQNAER